LAPMTSDHYDAIVVGSGFGGSVTAYRLAEPGSACSCSSAAARIRPARSRAAPTRRASFWDPRTG
jgi:cholesterol oxidase